MIKLVTESYCENCPEFEAEVDKLDLRDIGSIINDTLITCAHRDRCAAMYERLWLLNDKKEKKDE